MSPGMTPLSRKTSSEGSAPLQAGFTLIELMIVIAIIAIVSAMAIPQLQAARLTANEASAMSTLRAIANAQAQISAGRMIDTNSDGMGEFAYLAEMSGAVPMRIAAGGAPGPGLAGRDELLPSALSGALGRIVSSQASHSGYLFQVWLPGEPAAGLVPGVAEDATGGKLGAPFPDSGESAVRWCAYAWPMSMGTTGFPVFFISSEGELLRYNNRGASTYEGRAGGPPFDAAYTVAGDMSSLLAREGVLGVDGNIWTVLR
jgi:prepilin-type N-terminal cleavage/methylation domain-containing protein